MITIPRLQEFLCGISIKNGSYIVLATNLVRRLNLGIKIIKFKIIML